MFAKEFRNAVKTFPLDEIRIGFLQTIDCLPHNQSLRLSYLWSHVVVSGRQTGCGDKRKTENEDSLSHGYCNRTKARISQFFFLSG